MKTVLLTGASGFIGRHLVKYFKDNFKDEYRLVLLTSREIANELCILHKDYTFVPDNFKAKGIEHIDYVIHLGAYVGKTAKDSASATNNFSSVANTVYLLRNLPNVPEKVIYISSVAVYGFDAAAPYVPSKFPVTEENEPVPTKRNYALAKLFGEKIVLEYAEKNRCVTQVLRLGSIYGPDRKQGYFLGYILNSIKSEKLFKLSASPEYKYNFLHIYDACKFIIKALELEKYAGPINLVSSESITSLQICQLVKEIMPVFEYTVDSNGNYYGVDYWLVADKRERLLGEETYNLKSGLMQCLNLK